MSTHRRGKRGVCRGSDTPTIYVGDIDMYIPLEKPSHANCMQRIEMLGKAIWGLRKPFVGRGSTPDPAEGAYSAPQTP